MSASRKILIAAALLVLASPSLALALYKPSRVLMPSYFGVTCYDDDICIDTPERLQEARALRDEALHFVETQISPIKSPPPIIFCSTEECSRSFGFYHAAAYNVGTAGVVIRKRGWEPHFVRHELIHHLQNERLGSLTMFAFRPVWYREGMAYALSNDPRRPIPSQELEAWRAQFEAWAAHGSIWRDPR